MIAYTIKKSRRARNMRVTVNCDASVVVTTPWYISENKINYFLRQKMAWIARKVSYFKNLGPVIKLPRGKRAFVQYKNQAHSFVQNKIIEINSHYNFSFNKITIKNSVRRWGSCSKNKNLNFSFRVLFLAKELADYVITHELCHLKEFNHSKQFWALVAGAMPDFKARIKALRAIV